MNSKLLKSVLIVDDDELEFFIAKKILESTNGFSSIYNVTNGKEALELFKNFDESCQKYTDMFPPDLILLDINMPAMNGFEFLDAYQNLIPTHSNYPTPIVIMFTSSDEESDKAKSGEYPVVKDYLVKPLSYEKALKLVEEFGKENA